MFGTRLSGIETDLHGSAPILWGSFFDFSKIMSMAKVSSMAQTAFVGASERMFVGCIDVCRHDEGDGL